MSSRNIAVSFFVLLVLGDLSILLILSFATLTTRETGLLSTLLTLISILATWIVSHIYSERERRSAIAEAKDVHQENLRTFALKAAEKVTNLSEQLGHLIEFLEEELGKDDYETAKELINSREQRMESCAHMLAMLKSMNDTSLSDWQGVIGDELEEQREEKAEREARLIELADKLEKLISRAPDVSEPEFGPARSLDEQIEHLRNDLTRLATGVTSTRSRVRAHKGNIRTEVANSCPECGLSISYAQKPKKGSVKPLRCSGCGAGLMSIYVLDDEDFYLEKRRDIEEDVGCPGCNTLNKCFLNSFPGSAVPILCKECNWEYRAIREKTGSIRVKTIKGVDLQRHVLDEDFILRVQRMLPPQPWPRHVHKTLALELGVSNTYLQRAIRALIDRGEFYEQIDGELYELRAVDKRR